MSQKELACISTHQEENNPQAYCTRIADQILLKTMSLILRDLFKFLHWFDLLRRFAPGCIELLQSAGCSADEALELIKEKLQGELIAEGVGHASRNWVRQVFQLQMQKLAKIMLMLAKIMLAAMAYIEKD